MKVLISTEFYLPAVTGVVTAVFNQRRALEELGHEVRILTIGNVRKSYFDEEKGEYIIRRCTWQPYPDSYATLSFHDSLLKKIIDWNPEVIHAQNEFFTLSLAMYIKKHTGAFLLDTCHTDFSNYYMYFINNRKLWNWIIPKVIRYRLKSVDYVVCPTCKIFDMLTSYGVLNPMSVIPVGMDLEKYQQVFEDEERLKLRRELGVSDSDFLFVSVCRLGPEKNVSESIRYFSKLLEHRKNIKFLIVGSGTDEENLHNLVKELELGENVFFTGNVDPKIVWKYFRIGDVFVSSSRSEIQGLTYIEALASGVPLLCLEDQSLENTMQDGKNGFLFHNDSEFIDKACVLIDNADLRDGMQSFAPDSVKKYGLFCFGKKLEELYMERNKGKGFHK